MSFRFMISVIAQNHTRSEVFRGFDGQGHETVVGHRQKIGTSLPMRRNVTDADVSVVGALDDQAY